MGVLGGGLWSDDGILEEFYRFPSAHTAHGCLLEGAVLAIAGRFEPFSTGRGRITPERVDEMCV
jgi:predicted amino acid dehydrogenase